MNIIIDREYIQKIYDLMEDSCEGTICTEIRELVGDILRNNPEPEIGICKICGVKTNSNDSWADLNYCGPYWNKKRDKEYKNKGNTDENNNTN
jgi:hypothetical protein